MIPSSVTDGGDVLDSSSLLRIRKLQFSSTKVLLQDQTKDSPQLTTLFALVKL